MNDGSQRPESLVTSKLFGIPIVRYIKIAMSKPVKPKELEHLEPFVGTWHTEGLLKVNGKNGDLKITGTDSYEWLPGGFFLLHRVDVHIGSEHKEAIEVIGYNESGKTFQMQYFDNEGNTGTMGANVRNGVWTFLDKSMRFTGRFNDDKNVMEGAWEQFLDGKWVHWMKIKLTKHE
jgi:hypothetical protein